MIRILRQAWLLPVFAYRILLSPVMGRSCKYYPSCSSYMVDAVTKKGVIKGTLLGLWRILRCNPFSKGGYDPVD